MEFAGLEFAEIGCRGTMEALVTVDDGVDLVIRKSKPILRRVILQTLHFTELEERGCFLHGGFVFGFTGGLEGLEHGEVLLDGPVDALLVEREELELLRFHGEDARGGEGVVDLFVVEAELAAVFMEPKGKEVVLDGAGSVETPAVGGDALGELCFHGSLGCEVLYERFGE